MAKVIKGDAVKLFLDHEYDILIHGCNCLKTMGSGIAGQLARTFPEVPKADINYPVAEGVARLGDFSLVTGIDICPGQVIINAYTQLGYGSDPSIRYVSYDAVDESFEAIAAYLEVSGRSHWKICYPMIGAGLGNGHWPVIREIIDFHLKDFDHTLIEFEK